MIIMKPLNSQIIAALIAIVLSSASAAQNMNKADHSAQKDLIAADYKAGKAACKSFAGNANDICVAEAKGRKNIANASLEAHYKPSRDADYKIRVAEADADYGVAREKCDNQAGNQKSVCVKEAKAAQTTAKVDANAHMKVMNAKIVAGDKVFAARNDAAIDKDNANYAVALQKCDVFGGDVKARCVADAKATYGKL